MMRWSLFGILVLASLACSAPLLRYPRTISSAPELGKREEEACSIEGNDDFYGLGIRTGIYLQWISTIIANHYLKDAIGGSLVTNTIFLLALVIAMVVAAAEDSINAAEIAILLQLCFGFLFSVLSIWGIRTRDRVQEKPIRFPLMGAMARLTLSTAVCAYAVWFWLADATPAAGVVPSDGCTQYVFLFAKLDMSGNVKIVFAIQSIVILACFAWLNFNELIMIVCFLIYTIIWTILLAFLLVLWQALQVDKERSRRPSRQDSSLSPSKKLKEITKILISVFGRLPYLFYYCSAFAWRSINGKGSAGSDRPRLDLHLFLVINTIILCCRSTIHYWSLFIFGKAPAANFITMLDARYWLVLRRLSNVRSLVEGDPQLIRHLLWSCNILCIVWTILSVELTLVWNSITGIYQINTPGQLIPFIIGLVGLFQVIHGISVERSNIGMTEALLGLFDIQGLEMHDADEGFKKIDEHSPERGRSRVRNVRTRSHSGLADGIKQPVVIRSLSRARSENDFWEAHHRREAKTLDISSKQWHHWVSFRSLEKHYYHASNVEHYKPRSDSPFCIVKDFRKIKREYQHSRSRPAFGKGLNDRRCFSLPPPSRRSSMFSSRSAARPTYFRQLLRRMLFDIPGDVVKLEYEHFSTCADSTIYWFQRILNALQVVCDERIQLEIHRNATQEDHARYSNPFDTVFRELQIGFTHPVDIFARFDATGPFLWPVLTRMTCQKAPKSSDGIGYALTDFLDGTLEWPQGAEYTRCISALIQPDYLPLGESDWSEVLQFENSKATKSNNPRVATGSHARETMAGDTRESRRRPQPTCLAEHVPTDDIRSDSVESMTHITIDERRYKRITKSAPARLLLQKQESGTRAGRTRRSVKELLMLGLVLGTYLKVKTPWDFRAQRCDGSSETSQDVGPTKSRWMKSAKEAAYFSGAVVGLISVLFVIQRIFDRKTRRHRRCSDIASPSRRSLAQDPSSERSSISTCKYESSRTRSRRFNLKVIIDTVFSRQSPGTLLLKLVRYLQTWLDRPEGKELSKRLDSVHEFLRSARKVRLLRTTHEIGRTAQHEMIEQLWKEHLGEQFFENTFEDLRRGFRFNKLRIAQETDEGTWTFAYNVKQYQSPDSRRDDSPATI